MIMESILNEHDVRLLFFFCRQEFGVLEIRIWPIICEMDNGHLSICFSILCCGFWEEFYEAGTRLILVSCFFLRGSWSDWKL